jgi:DNA processing protein
VSPETKEPLSRLLKAADRKAPGAPTDVGGRVHLTHDRTGPDAAESLVPIVRPGDWPQRFVAGKPDRDALLVLAHLEGLTPRDLHDLAWREGTARGCLRAAQRGAVSELDARRANSLEAVQVRAAMRRCGVGLIAPGDAHYPEALLDLPDPPGWLFVRGRLPPGGWRQAVAIVGARNCSPYGEEVAELMGSGLAGAGVAVVSGAARGIDGAAHRGALAVGGPTVAVLGSGIDVPYPPGHREMLQRIAACGAVVSEYPPGFRAHQRRFPARNRIVAALAKLTVVVEGAPGSGSLITAEFAQDLHRDLLAVPGPVTSELSAAPHELIRDGAGLVRDAGDVLEALGLVPRRTSRRGGGSEQPTTPSEDGSTEAGSAPVQELPRSEHLVLESLGGTGQVIEQVARRSGLPTSDALRALVALELRGLVVVTGGRYRRPATPSR